MRPRRRARGRRSRATSGRGASGVHAALLRLARTRSTCTSTAAPGRVLGDLLAQLGPVDGLPQVDQRRQLADLVAAAAADEVPPDAAAPRPRLRLGQQLLRVVLADVGEPAAERRLDRVGAEALGDGDDAHPVGVTAGRRSMRGAHLDRAARRRRHGSSQTTTARRAASARGAVRPVDGRARGAHAGVDERGHVGLGQGARTPAVRSSAGVPQAVARTTSAPSRAGPPRGRRRRTRSTGGCTARRRPRCRARRARAWRRPWPPARRRPGRATRRGRRRPPRRPTSATGAQSAVCTASAAPGAAVTAASAVGAGAARRARRPRRPSRRAPAAARSTGGRRAAATSRRATSAGSTSAGRRRRRCVNTRTGGAAGRYFRNDGTSKSSSPSRSVVLVVAGVEEVRGSTRLERPRRRRPRPRRPLALVPAVEAGGDDGDPDLVAHLVVDDRAEDDVGVLVGDAVDDLGRRVHLEQAEVGRPPAMLSRMPRAPSMRRLEQRAGDGGRGRGDAPGPRRWPGRCP